MVEGFLGCHLVKVEPTAEWPLFFRLARRDVAKDEIFRHNGISERFPRRVGMDFKIERLRRWDFPGGKNVHMTEDLMFHRVRFRYVLIVTITARQETAPGHRAEAMRGPAEEAENRSAIVSHEVDRPIKFFLLERAHDRPCFCW